MREKIKNLVNFHLSLIGLKLIKKSRDALLSERLMHMKNLGFSPQVIFDCGAYIGEWTLKASEIFPKTQFLLVEPNTMVINRTKANISDIRPKPILLEATAVGDNLGSGYLNIWANEHTSIEGSSLLSHVQGEPKRKIAIEILTLDSVSEKYNLKPDLVKLDLQGTELSALKGTNNIMRTTTLFIIEFGCLEAYVNRTTPRELMDIMYDNNYCLYDVVDLVYRPYDRALCGGDFFFIKKRQSFKKI
ncbi:MAG: hypothetical protein SCARUB_00320 [Candidatus Scalindua rubra]|uniref:Methyltransferase FkbM domain-containing protein n=1 Tax=Candidatus Scalindua rubra TaxID=1872076 RepID=A0A1E3XG25_9BACT|nr:MAG: hypothetical protein SCARUB_00320 [Candidatus Scalindua rubra]